MLKSANFQNTTHSVHSVRTVRSATCVRGQGLYTLFGLFNVELYFHTRKAEEAFFCFVLSYVMFVVWTSWHKVKESFFFTAWLQHCNRIRTANKHRSENRLQVCERLHEFYSILEKYSLNSDIPYESPRSCVCSFSSVWSP